MSVQRLFNVMRVLNQRIRGSLHCKNFQRIYGRIADTQLPIQVPLFLREPVKLSRMTRQYRARYCYLEQRSNISCNNVNMSTYFYLLPGPYPSHIKVLRATVKVTVNSLAAGCLLFYRKIYEHFLQCTGWALFVVGVDVGVIGVCVVSIFK